VKLILSILFIYSLNVNSAELPTRWRLEYNYGKVTTNYLEEQPSIVFEKKNIKQVSDFHQFAYQYYLLPPLIDFTIGANTTGTQIDDPTDINEQFRYFTAYANIGILLPLSDYWSVKLVLESFYTSMQVKDDAFGFKNLRGNQVYPEIEWLPFGSDIFIQFSPYAKIPIYSDSVGGRKETTFGLKMKVPLGAHGAMKFPTFAYQNALTIKIFYTSMELDFTREDFIGSEISTKQVGVTIGFNI
jgi:hypothetical protein